MLYAILLAYAHGQRISDVVQLHYDDVVEGNSFVSLFRRRGKVVTSTEAFTTHLGARTPLASLVLKQARQASSEQSFLFTKHNTLKERQVFLSQIKRTLHSLSPELELRSIRRGGLMQMAVNGEPLETIRELLSKHSSNKTLLGYLDSGSVVRHNALTTSRIAAQLIPELAAVRIHNASRKK
jgi:integrase